MSSNKYNHLEIEAKWRKQWEDKELYRTPKIEQGDKKKYILETFPYPSGDGLHVGHAEGYTASDITARYSRMKGFKVMYPMGWDSFGLPAENFAIKKGVHPKDSTSKAISNFKNQVQRLGASYDWEKEITTCHPDYYKWTQWFFELLYNRGLAYKKEALVNWDPVDQTVLANEQVLSDGTAERSGAKVEQRMMNQWFFKITDYAERLLEGLDDLDWPESTKQMQRNWIGKSEGAEVDFELEDITDKVRVFTTRVDTIFGATYLVLAPEHHLVERIVSEEKLAEVQSYIEKTKTKSELQRTDLNKDKTGVFTGAYAINPVSGARVPIFIADYVLSTYGTGAIMAVPAHDQRDFEFLEEMKKEQYPELELIEVIQKPQDFDGSVYSDYGILQNSDLYDGLSSGEAKARICGYLQEKNLGGAKITYRLRDWLVSRQRYWGSPIPIYYDESGKEYLVPEGDLPVILPDDVEFVPTGRSPLIDHINFHKSAEEKYGRGVRREVDTMDTFVCSSWYFFRYCSPKNKDSFSSIEEMKKWMPVDQYIIGAEHSTLHLLYARFFTKVLFDSGYIDFEEPFLKLRHQGLILGENNFKMSKSKGNVVNPDDMYELYGADSLRMYEMFMGPFDQPKPWNTNTVKGVRRFLDRVWKLQYCLDQNVDITPERGGKVEIALHKLVKKVGEDIEGYSFNTSVAEFMKFLNLVEEVKYIHTVQYKWFLILLAPFAPFITEEIYQSLDTDNKKSSIHLETWPEYMPEMLNYEDITYAVQINGKVRLDFKIESTADETTVLEKAKSLAQPWLLNKEIKFSRVIPKKIVTFVTA